ncbi:MAG: glycosyltransferase [Microthrixaceae bacterium]
MPTPTAVGRIGVLSMHTSPLAQPGSADAGGMNVYVRELAASLAQAGVAVRVYTRADRSSPPHPVVVEPNLVVVPVPAGRADLPKEALSTVVDEFAAGVADDLRSHGGTDAIHANYWLSGVAGGILARQLGVPLAVTFHTLARVKAAHGDPEPAGREQAEADIVAAASVLCAASASDADDLVGRYGANPDRVTLVPPGVQHAFFSPGSRAGARAALGLNDSPHVLFVGRIQPLKGLDLAVSAVAALRRNDVRLLAVGGPSGPHGAAELARVHNLVAAAGLGDRVRCVEPQPHHILSTYYRAADVVVVPSRTESFGLVALEAASCGRPVVAADVGGLRSLVIHERTGLRVAGRDPLRWGEALSRVLDDPDRAAAMGRAGAELGRTYRWSATARALLDALAAVR